MSFRNKVYDALVNKVPGIQERYQGKRETAKGGVGRATSWLYLAGLNFSYHVLRNRKLHDLQKYPPVEFKKLYIKGSESSACEMPAPEKLAMQLNEYDVISFDVFDTLIFRPFSDPKDLFYFVGDRLGYPSFRDIRASLENQARQNKARNAGSKEVTLMEIYSLIAAETGINQNEGMRAEYELEKLFCFANPYMKSVVDILNAAGKKIIITSDMYLSEKNIAELVRAAGYKEFSAIHVSCELDKSKSNGDMYDYLCEKYKGKSIVHVGDNYYSDYKQATKHGVDAIEYMNVNTAGKPYRTYDMSEMMGSLYRGIVNTHIHNGMNSYSREYEYGFIYGGLFVTGYCQFIHQQAQEFGADKILFLARDGYVLSQAYKMIYPDESEICEYTYWSRLAGTKMAASRFRYDYIQRFLSYKINQDYTIEQIFSSMELTDMLPDMINTTGVSRSDVLTRNNIETVKSFMFDHWTQVLAHYKEQVDAGKIYYSEILRNKTKALIVDIGWAGSATIQLDYLINNIWEIGCEVRGLLAGTCTAHNTEPNVAETFLQSGKLKSYLYSQSFNRDLWKDHNPNHGHNLYWELLLDAPHGSLIGFYKDGKDCKFKFKDMINYSQDITDGILAFVQEWISHVHGKALEINISGRDAYAPMKLALNDKNKNFLKSLNERMDELNI